MRFLYNLGIFIYTAAARIMSPFDNKARLWVSGRKNWKTNLENRIDKKSEYIWMHCASLGEFEQGRPLIETFKKISPEKKIIITFFSPSGYEIRKDYQLADYVCYLPADTQNNARKFVSIIKPALVIFVKYEFWHNYTLEISRQGIPLYLISGIFRPGQHFFSWYGPFFRKILLRFNHIFVQDKNSYDLLLAADVKNITLAGDTRFDRVLQIAESAKKIPLLEIFRANEKIFLAGSSWRQDEEIIARYVNRNPFAMKWVFAPHEVDKENISRLEKLFNTTVIRFSQLSEKNAASRVLIIDNIGMLSSAYSYAYIAGIGGGFGRGIHNILEAACWGIPVIFGPNYKNFREAVDLINQKGAISFKTYREFENIVDKWLTDEQYYRKSAEASLRYVRENRGATSLIISKIIGRDINNTP